MKNTEINLNKGKIIIYDFNTIKVHNYVTNDLLSDQVIMLEKNNQLVIIESPTFQDNTHELEDYITSLNLEVSGILLSYHFSGASFLKDAQAYATKKADNYGHEGGGKVLVDNFTKAFGTTNFDNKIHDITNYIEESTLTLGSITFNIIPTLDAYDIEIPEINSIYTHMLGSACHSIIAGQDNALNMIKTLKDYIVKNYNLILTSHYVPETIKAAQIKIDYINNLLNIAANSNNATEMITKVKQQYPNYTGENYLEMTANFFFTK